MPSDAAVVVDLKLLEDFDNIKNYPIWKNFQGTRGFNSIDKGISFLDSINGDGGFSAIFKKVPTLISMHRVASSSLDFLFVVDIRTLSQNTFVSVAIGRLKTAGYRFKTRNYNGFKISEIGKRNQLLTYIFYKNFFLASFTPHLVEDAIRTIDNSTISSFKEVHAPSTTGNIHINFNQFENLLEVFTNRGVDIPLTSGSYKLSMDSSFVHLSGFSKSENWLSTHTEVPRKFEMAEVIPFNTAFLYHITSSDFTEWKNKRVEFLSKSSAIDLVSDSLEQKLDFSPEEVFDLVDDEIGLAHIESNRLGDDRRLLILKTKDINKSLQYFEQLAERIAYARGDSVYTEAYSESEIRFFPIQDFPMMLLGELAGSFEKCFYISHRNYLVFSNSLQELKNLVSLTQSEETWGKSLQMNDFLSRSNEAANVSLFVNIPRLWSKLLALVKPNWTASFKADENSFKRVDLVAFQFSYLNDSYYTSFMFSQPTSFSKNVVRTNADNKITFVSPLISKPHLVQTHAHNYLDIIVQDSSNAIHFLDRSFSSQWTKDLGEPIVSELFGIDYYKNGKIQYAFASSSKVHIIDRTGAYIPGFPKALPNVAKIDFFNLIDYSKNKNYRMGITDEDGKIFLTGKDVNALEGWNPLPYTRAAINPLRHARLGRKEVMISIQENGIINIVSRKGIKQNGFPFDTKNTLDNNYFLSSSNSLGRSSLSVISTQGELIEINLEGRVISRNQLIKTSSETAFKLVPDRGETSFIIIRKEGSIHEVLDATGNLLFSKDYASQSQILIQYYQFGGGKNLIIFTDTANKRLYIYDKSGNLITGDPLNSSHEAGIVYSSSKKELQVYTTSASDLNFYQFNY